MLEVRRWLIYQTTELSHKGVRIEKTLGSAKSCDLVVEDASVDAYHLQIANTPDDV